ncbi:hypothetical protein FOQG_15791 [Fusarium oxysporum f. sp. raphani 54005]|uniref:Uncharacterized protein n=4 Tax=Fusarium oxysporum TaxID=5507 RepID=X0BCU0_FUSOX|nr:hypothetical protein FOVG_08094 [Fusarium oxysporum f. sp. pisi HDV247]EXK79606.1 hypothetical protein FOQG_15791 [Fusarium oxysporum f. sp. raphani 54005]EXM19960.1 hypothetical protein FOTG_12188 [Fusarium oxysporum f. sp. vasinfectum 25433]KAG7433699.1 hypothetical protein Forpi1262_v004685 [Fusarium oxysporum f. sp. raphani]KAJ4057559.1 hypothetical protein NW758_001980 [Fusarium oxysporum]KAK2677803.1 hypothetical protein RAB80_006543 [Fusarium oxysporum f. sp. vasinfectum]
MPTSTEFFGVTAYNLGPLTTTFSAPSACATGTDHHVIVNASEPEMVWGYPTCGFQDRGSCMPSGKSYDSLRSVTTPLNRAWYHYYSPGIACPSGWTTAGTMIKEGESSLSVSGVFSSRIQASTTGAVQLEPADFWAEIMNVSETIAYCCPSDYVANPAGHCFSTVGPRSEFNYSSMCYTPAPVDIITVTSLDGASLTQPLISFDVLTTPASTYLDDRLLTQSRYSSDFVVATWVPAVPLIHQQSDVDEADDEDDEENDGGDDGDGEDTDGNAASTKTPGNGIVSVLGLTLGALAGMGMLL